MESRIVSLNLGAPAPMEWDGKSVVSSMLRHPVPGPLVVHRDHIEGNGYGNPQLHGLEHSVLYVYGNDAALAFVSRIGLVNYVPGTVGENVTVDRLDEAAVSVGDIFEIGEVRAQATWPRTPCGKVIIRMGHPQAQRAMQECGRSGIYFRVLKPGKIFLTDTLRLVEPAVHRFPIAYVYRKLVENSDLSLEEMQVALRNGAFPRKAMEKWKAALSSPAGDVKA